MAVRIDVEAFRESLPAGVADAAAGWLGEDGGLGELEPVGGGVQATAGAYRPWVGIVDGAFTSSCGCPDGRRGICAHAAAVVLAAVDDGVPFSPAATPPEDEAGDADRLTYVEAARRLTPERLVELVATHASRDDLLAAQLLEAAALADTAGPR